MEFKAVGQGGKTASTSLAAGIEWRLQALLAGDALEIQDRVDADRVRVQNQPLKAKNAVVKGGEPFLHQSSSVVPNNPDEIVTVYSDPDPDKKGVEWYEVRKYKKPFAITSPEYKKGYEAHVAAIDVNNDTQQHRMNLRAGLVDLDSSEGFDPLPSVSA